MTINKIEKLEAQIEALEKLQAEIIEFKSKGAHHRADEQVVLNIIESSLGGKRREVFEAKMSPLRENQIKKTDDKRLSI